MEATSSTSTSQIGSYCSCSRLNRSHGISAGKLLFDNMLRDYTRDNLSFRFSPGPKSDAENVESQLAAGRWPNGKKPLLNPS